MGSDADQLTALLAGQEEEEVTGPAAAGAAAEGAPLKGPPAQVLGPPQAGNGMPFKLQTKLSRQVLALLLPPACIAGHSAGKP